MASCAIIVVWYAALSAWMRLRRRFRLPDFCQSKPNPPACRAKKPVLMPSYKEALQAYAATATAFNTRISAAIDGIAADLDSLNALILQLQNNPGPISPEDQAILDTAVAAGEALAARLESLDAITPPGNPPVTP